MDLPRPDSDLPHLGDVVPSVLAALGAPDFDRRIPLRDGLSGASVLLIDGLGAELLDTHAADAPVLAGLRGQTLSVGFHRRRPRGWPPSAPDVAAANTAWSATRSGCQTPV